MGLLYKKEVHNRESFMVIEYKNIGSYPGKVRAHFQNLEGSDLVTDYADVIVADGFSGNLLLKCAESVGKAAMRIAEKYGADSPVVQAICRELWETFDFNSRGAATFLGTRKTVAKMHGAANADTAAASIAQILRLEDSRFSQKMAEEFSK